jgi:twitching motility protein PilT
MSRLDPLVDALRKTDADEVRLVVGERIYLLNGGKRVEIGREPVQRGTLAALAAEVFDAKVLASIHDEKRSARVERLGVSIEVTAQVLAGALTVIIKRAPAPVSPTKAAEAEPEPAKPKGASASVPPALGARPASTVAAPKRERLIDEILDEMMSMKASDLHLSSNCPPAMRVHGEMHFSKERPVLSSDAILELVGPIFSEKARKDFDEKHDADFAYEVPGLARFRVNAFLDRNGIGAVLRQIPIDIIPAEKLGLPQALIDLCFLTKGLVVVTGPTGSGKSTTLAGMVDYINKNRSDHIITIEDPIEFVHKNIKCLVNQREIGQHTMGFKNALRAALREDPDIVLVGEMRDLETVAIAIETAETGHLVFGTLHTTTAMSTVDRIIDQFPTDQQQQIRVMLSSSLKGVIAQVLCKKIGGGRVAAMEILLGNSAVAALIREGKTYQIASVMQTARGAGMVTMNDSLLALVQQKLVEPKEAWMKSVDKTGLLGMYKGAGIPMPT